MKYYTLRFDSELQATTLADRLGYLDDEGNLISLGHAGAIHQIGTATIPGIYNSNGDELSPPKQVSGFFVNIAIENLPAALVRYQVPYGSGGNIFAGTMMDEGAWPPL